MRDLVHSFIGQVIGGRPQFGTGCKVLEIGRYNINGTARDHFHGCDYVGVDWRPGPCVDVVGMAHEVEFPDGQFDVVLSVESLEHDFYWRQTLAAMYRLLRPGGLFLLTVASFDFPPHEPDCSTRPGYYHNLMPDELLPVLNGTMAKRSRPKSACRKEFRPLASTSARSGRNRSTTSSTRSGCIAAGNAAGRARRLAQNRPR
jgi:SAM-dependent methyltransferase